MDTIMIGKFIAKLRKDKNMTQEQLGEVLGISNKTVSRWESGNYMPSIEMLQQLSQIFEVSINELLAGEYISNEDFRKQADKNLIDATKKNAYIEISFKLIGIFGILVFLCGFGMFILNCFFRNADSYWPFATYIATVMMIVPSIYFIVLFVLQIIKITRK